MRHRSSKPGPMGAGAARLPLGSRRWPASRSSRPRARRAPATPAPTWRSRSQALHEGDEYQAAALLFAVARLGCEREARALLDRGAAIDAKDREGATALAKAAQAGKIEVVALLHRHGAPTSTPAPSMARRRSSTPPKRIAAAAIRLLLDRGADPNIPGAQGRSRPLAAAAYNGSADSVELLLKHGADPNALDDDGKSAMVYAAGRAYAPIVELLIDAGVDVNRRYAHGLTALMWAAGHDASRRRRRRRRDAEAAHRARRRARASRTTAARPPPTSPATSGMSRRRSSFSDRARSLRAAGLEPGQIGRDRGELLGRDGVHQVRHAGIVGAGAVAEIGHRLRRDSRAAGRRGAARRNRPGTARDGSSCRRPT